MNARRQSGFTLIELVVTVAIIGLLSSMAMPLTQLIMKRTREHELHANLRDIRDALDRYNELWRYSCLNPPPAAGAAGGAGAPAGAFGAGAPGLPGAAGAAGGNAAGGFGAGANTVSGFGAGNAGAPGSVAAAGLGGAGGVGAAALGGAAGGNVAALPTPPRMECIAGATGWPKDLQTLVDGVTNIASPQPGAKVYFLRRIPRDPLSNDFQVAADLTWGKRSSASSADDPQEGDDVFDVYTLSTALDLTGRAYRDW